MLFSGTKNSLFLCGVISSTMRLFFIFTNYQSTVEMFRFILVIYFREFCCIIKLSRYGHASKIFF